VDDNPVLDRDQHAAAAVTAFTGCFDNFFLAHVQNLSKNYYNSFVKDCAG
jgi:hypothetical protein